MRPLTPFYGQKLRIRHNKRPFRFGNNARGKVCERHCAQQASGTMFTSPYLLVLTASGVRCRSAFRAAAATRAREAAFPLVRSHPVQLSGFDGHSTLCESRLVLLV